MKVILIFILSLFCGCHVGHSADILAVLTIPSPDDQYFFSTLTLELARRGHRLVVITPDPRFHRAVNATNYDVIDTSNIYNHIDEFPIKDIADIVIESSMGIFLYSQNSLESFELQMKNPQVKALLKNKKRKFDLIIADGFIPTAFAFSEYFKAPFVNLVSHHNLVSTYDAIGNPTHPLLYRDLVSTWEYTNVFNRLMAGYTHFTSQMMQDSLASQGNALVAQYLNVTRPLQEIAKDAAITLVNGYQFTSGIRPIVPSLKFVGGMHLRAPAPLPEDIKIFLENVKSYVIYVNLGQDPKDSYISMDTRRQFIHAFEQLDYKFIWLWGNDGIPQPTKKSRYVTDRLLQQDILGSDKVKLFITQGDQRSIEEAIYHEVPMLVLPTKFGYNVHANFVASNKIGNQAVPIIDELLKSIHEARGERVYKKQIKTLKQQLFDQPETALERAVFWTEYVIRHKGSLHLKVASMPFYQYFFLDAIAFGIVAGIISLYLTYAITRFWIRFWWRRRHIVIKLGKLVLYLILLIKNMILRLYRSIMQLYGSKRTVKAVVEKKEKTN